MPRGTDISEEKATGLFAAPRAVSRIVGKTARELDVTEGIRDERRGKRERDSRRSAESCI